MQQNRSITLVNRVLTPKLVWSAMIADHVPDRLKTCSAAALRIGIRAGAVHRSARNRLPQGRHVQRRHAHVRGAVLAEINGGQEAPYYPDGAWLGRREGIATARCGAVC